MSEQTQDQTTVLRDIVISDSVAVVTGGASGIGSTSGASSWPSHRRRPLRLGAAGLPRR